MTDADISKAAEISEPTKSASRADKVSKVARGFVSRIELLLRTSLNFHCISCISDWHRFKPFKSTLTMIVLSIFELDLWLYKSRVTVTLPYKQISLYTVMCVGTDLLKKKISTFKGWVTW